jgi:hypothetical protein
MKHKGNKLLRTALPDGSDWHFVCAENKRNKNERKQGNTEEQIKGTI